jgi:hypothetical protein
MIAEIPPGAFQVPDNALWNIAGYVLTVLIAGFSGYRWGLKSQIYAKILEVKTDMLPLIEGFILWAESGEFHGLWTESRTKLFDPAMKLKSLITGNKQVMFLKSWDAFYNTSKDELHCLQPNETAEQGQKMKVTIIARLKALQSAIQRI